MNSLARILLAPLRNYLGSEQGRKDYAEWTAKKQLNIKSNKNNPIEDIGIAAKN